MWQMECIECFDLENMINLFFCADQEKTEQKKAHKQAVKEEKREKRRTKVPKHAKKRKDKVAKQKYAK